MSPKEMLRRHGFFKYNQEEKYHLVKEARREGLLKKLNPKEQYVVRARFPPQGELVSSFTMIGEGLYPNRPAPVSRENIRQIQEIALGKLKRWLETNI